MDASKIILTVANEYRVNPKAIMGKMRLRDVSEARHMCAYIMQENNISLCAITGLLNRKSKSIYYAIRHFRALLSVDKSVKQHYESIKKELELWAQH